jgi:hypothetical protein
VAEILAETIWKQCGGGRAVHGGALGGTMAVRSSCLRAGEGRVRRENGGSGGRQQHTGSLSSPACL